MSGGFRASCMAARVSSAMSRSCAAITQLFHWPCRAKAVQTADGWSGSRDADVSRPLAESGATGVVDIEMLLGGRGLWAWPPLEAGGGASREGRQLGGSALREEETVGLGDVPVRGVSRPLLWVHGWRRWRRLN